MHVLSNTKINFMAWRKLAVILSAAMLLLSLGALSVNGLNLGIDFTGGTLVEVQYPAAADLTEIRAALEEGGYPRAVVQNFGSSRDVLIRIPLREDVVSATLGDQVVALLSNSNPGVQLQRQEFVGPQVGEELREKGGLALLYALIGILIYVSLRFQYRLAVGSVAALAHDVIIVIGIFALLGLEFDLTIIAAILAVIGYSLNDTIVVFDRIRENFRKMRKGTPEEVTNTSLNQMLSRTLVTSLTTILVLAALLIFGGELIFGFALALMIGVVVGTYSSIYVASAAALALGLSKEDLMPVPKEGEEQEDRGL